MYTTTILPRKSDILVTEQRSKVRIVDYLSKARTISGW